ncbi:MAG: class II aldolase/adducin family protein [Betaproteobacteria bacterium]|nr:MAG: class II aldolase/adducin family protein [Betaproteobacteria bacterium]
MGLARHRETFGAPRHLQLPFLGRRRQRLGDPLQSERRLHLDLRAGRSRGPGTFRARLPPQAAGCEEGGGMRAARSMNGLRRDVALANRIIERFGLSGAFGHVSARIPGTDRFYFPTRRSPGLASAGELLVLDTEGKILSGKGTPNSELWIHARLYAARPDVGGVVHAHPPASICLTQIGQPHRVVHNQGGAFHAGVPEFERISLIRTRELGDLLARKLGAGLAVMMRGHGITTALPDVRAATVAACMLEESAGMQLRMLAAAGGDPARIRVYTREEAESMGDQVGPRVVERAWEYYSIAAEARPLGR